MKAAVNSSAITEAGLGGSRLGSAQADGVGGSPPSAGAGASAAPIGSRLFSSAPFNQAMGLYLSATALFRLINFGRILLLTWFMTQQQFGLLTMILAVLNVLTPLCSLGLNEAVTRYVPQHETKGSLRKFMVQSFTLLMAFTTLSVALIWIFAGSLGVFFYAQVFTDAKLFAEFKADAPELAQLSGVVIGLLIVYFYMLAVLKGLRMFTALAVMELVHGVFFLGASVWAVWSGHLSAFTLTALYGASLLVPIVFFGIGLIRSVQEWEAQHHPSGESQWAQRLLRFSVWTTLAGITWQALVYYPAWFLTKVNGHEAVAVFNAVRQIGQFILIGAVAVVTVVMTTVTKTWESRGRDAGRRQLSLAFRGTGLGLLVFCAMLSISRFAIIRLFKQDYAPGADILPLHLLFFLLGAFLAFLPIHFHLTEKTRHSFWPWAIGVAANMLYAFWLAGPGFQTVKNSATWQWASAWARPLFTTGFSDPQGLGNAAWCGVFAIATALVLCVVLIRAECSKLDRGTYVVIFASSLLALNDYLMIGGTLILIVLALRTRLVFTPEERRRVYGYIMGSLGHVPPLHVLVRRRNGK